MSKSTFFLHGQFSEFFSAQEIEDAYARNHNDLGAAAEELQQRRKRMPKYADHVMEQCISMLPKMAELKRYDEIRKIIAANEYVENITWSTHVYTHAH